MKFLLPCVPSYVNEKGKNVKNPDANISKHTKQYFCVSGRYLPHVIIFLISNVLLEMLKKCPITSGLFILILNIIKQRNKQQ